MNGEMAWQNAKLVSELLESLFRGEKCLDQGDNYVFVEGCCLEITGYARGSEIIPGTLNRRQTFAISCKAKFEQPVGQFVNTVYTPRNGIATFTLHFREDDSGNMENPIIWPVSEYPWRQTLLSVPAKEVNFFYGQSFEVGDESTWMDIVTADQSCLFKEHPPMVRLGVKKHEDGGYEPVCETDDWQIIRLPSETDTDWAGPVKKIITGVGQAGWGSF